MVGALFDTNILIGYLAGVPQARQELQGFTRKAIGVITWAEVMVGVDAKIEVRTRNFLRQFEILEAGEVVADRAVHLRRRRRIELPDALIWATAETRALILVTRNTKDFPAGDAGIRTLRFELTVRMPTLTLRKPRRLNAT